MLKSLVFGVALVAAPLAAQAVTIGGSATQANTNLSVGEIWSGNAISESGDLNIATAWKFTALEDLRITGTGSVNGVSAFVQPIRVSYSTDGTVGGITESFAFSPVINDTQSYALTAKQLGLGEMIYVLVEYAGALQADADIDFRLQTTAVPVPAAGLLFLSALAGMGFLARRKTA